MCSSCNDRVLDMILDYVLLGFHLDISVALARDSITQKALQMFDDDEKAIEHIRHFSDIVDEQAIKLWEMSRDDFRDLLTGRALIETLS